jgi:ankyrin repeat protein
MKHFLLFIAVLASVLEIGHTVSCADTDIRLCVEVISGNIAKVGELVDEGSDLNTAECLNGMTPLSAAAMYNHAEIAKLLVDKGADVNIRDKNKMTALMVAAEKGFFEIAKFLIDKGADINVKDKDGRTPLLIALDIDIDRFKLVSEKIKAGVEIGERVLIAKLLIERNADVTVKDNNKRTPLIVAVENDHVEIVKLLLNKGVDVNINDRNGRTVLITAANKGYLEIVRLLLDRVSDINARDNTGMTALFAAVKSWCLEMIKQPPVKAHRLKIRKYKEDVFLTTAAEPSEVYEEIIRLLLNKGADVNIQDNSGKTALMIAVKNKNMEIIKLLLKKHADIKAKDNKGRTVLIIASDKDNEEIVELLLDKGADVNIQDDSGRTALMAAVESRNVDIVKLLLKKGSDVNAVDRNGSSSLMVAMDIAANRFNRFLQKIFDAEISSAPVTKLSAGKSFYSNIWNDRTIFILPDDSSSIEMAKLLINKGANINAKDSKSRTPLMIAAEKGYIEIVKLLINRGADVNVRRHDGETALGIALQKGNFNTARLLRFAGGIE